jgi:aldose sugar dehydrogenase
MSASAGSLPRSSWWRRILLGVAFLAVTAGAFVLGVLVHKYRVQIRGRLTAMQSGGILSANLYNLSIQKISIPAEGRDGGIAAVGDGVLMVNRLGRMWFVDERRVLHPLPMAVPVNVQEFLDDPHNADLITPDRFGVKDILLQETPTGTRLFASHNQWNAEKDCYVLRVSMLEVSAAALQAQKVDTASSWRTVWETTPCYELSTLAGGVSPHPTLGAGGRLALRTADELLVTVGGFKGENDPIPPEFYWATDNSYGKAILVDLRTGTSRTFAVGLRNPQGLMVAPDGKVYETEHAARGGDELNVLVDGQNYGYPAVSYGTSYDMMTWPSNPQQGRHEGFAKPLYSWVPSIGISQLISLEKGGFPYWQGDLIVGSMAMETLYRMRIEDGRVVYAEPLRIEHRARDIVETNRGEIVVKTDDDFLIYLTNVTAGSAAAAALPPVERGQLLATTCLGCHSLSADGANGIGPALHGVVGRDIASVAGYRYSSGLTAVRGSWTVESLEQFISDPSAFAPGTTMAKLPSYSPEQLQDLLTYLGSLR